MIIRAKCGHYIDDNCRCPHQGDEMKFRKKPIVVEAMQFFENTFDGWPLGVYKDGDGHAIDTLEGPLNVSEGDWIVTGIKGERYPVKPDIFAATYEKVEG